MTTTARQWQLVRRPQGRPDPADFELVEAELADPADGQVLVRNVFSSVDPYMRGRMNEGRSYAPPYRLGEPMYGGAVGVVAAAGSDALPVGTAVLHNAGWRTHALLPATACQPVDPAGVGLAAYLGVLGMPGMTAYVGLFDIGQPRPGETVFVSAAAGAVGSIVGQLAHEHGCRVVGSAGSAEKCRWLTDDLGFDAAINYHDGHLTRALAQAAPDGVDVYFDNVGGDHLQAALAAMNDFGRIAACGMISQYNEPTPGPTNLFLVVGRRLRMQGFIISDHAERRGAFLEHVGGLLRAGRLRSEQTVVDGVENHVRAFLDLLDGGHHRGKLLVAVGEAPAGDAPAG